MNKYIVASYDMDNSPRHCWIGKDNIRYLDTAGDFLHGDTTEICTLDHQMDYKLVGPVEWLSVIKKFIILYREAGGPEETNPFTDAYDNPAKRLVLNPFHHYMVNNQVYTYAEEYWLEKENVLQKFQLVFAVYLNNKERKANITLFDTAYKDIFEQAIEGVKKDYAMLKASMI